MMSVHLRRSNIGARLNHALMKGKHIHACVITHMHARERWEGSNPSPASAVRRGTTPPGQESGRGTRPSPQHGKGEHSATLSHSGVPAVSLTLKPKGAIQTISTPIMPAHMLHHAGEAGVLMTLYGVCQTSATRGDEATTRATG